MKWTQEREQTLEAGWLAHLPISQIARDTGATERAVAHKRYEMGLPPRSAGCGPHYRNAERRFRSGWTEERVARVKQLAQKGTKDAEIARELGGFGHTRDGGKNAVASKRHKLGIQTAAPTDRRQASARRYQASPINPVGIPPSLPVEEPASASAIRFGKSFAALGKNDCRWPFGTPGEPGFFFCGGEKLSGLPYCRDHCRIAYNAPADRWRN